MYISDAEWILADIPRKMWIYHFSHVIIIVVRPGCGWLPLYFFRPSCRAFVRIAVASVRSEVRMIIGCEDFSHISPDDVSLRSGRI